MVLDRLYVLFFPVACFFILMRETEFSLSLECICIPEELAFLLPIVQFSTKLWIAGFKSNIVVDIHDHIYGNGYF